jgi:hypothetical protein
VFPLHLEAGDLGGGAADVVLVVLESTNVVLEDTRAGDTEGIRHQVELDALEPVRRRRGLVAVL